MISNNHTEQATAYVLGALEDDERIAFELALQESPDLQREVAELREVAGLIALAVRPMTPPASLRERVVSDARAVRPIAPRLAEAAQRREPSPPAPLRAVISQLPRERWSLAQMIGWLTVAASVSGAAVAYNLYREQSATTHALAQANRDLRTRLSARDSLLGVLMGPEVVTVRLSSPGAPRSARLFWNRASHQIVLVTFSLPNAPAGRTYQLWGTATGRAPVSLGTFNTSAIGEGRLTVKVPEGLEIVTSAVTEEPAGGSPQPTSTPILVGTFGGAR